MSDRPWQAVRLSDVPGATNADGPAWAMVRHHLGIEAFGVNAWTATEAGRPVIGEHDETRVEHEELYVVLSGHATFTVADEAIDAPAGTMVFVRDVAAKRAAVAREAGTTVLAVGAKAGEAFTPSAWEAGMVEGIALLGRGEPAQAAGAFAAALTQHPDDPGLLYNLACAESLAGDADSAFAHLERSVSLDGRFAEYAQSDPDFDPIRADERFAPVAGAEKGAR